MNLGLALLSKKHGKKPGSDLQTSSAFTIQDNKMFLQSEQEGLFLLPLGLSLPQLAKENPIYIYKLPSSTAASALYLPS